MYKINIVNFTKAVQVTKCETDSDTYQTGESCDVSLLGNRYNIRTYRLRVQTRLDRTVSIRVTFHVSGLQKKIIIRENQILRKGISIGSEHPIVVLRDFKIRRKMSILRLHNT